VLGSTNRVLHGVALRDRLGGGQPITDAEIGWTGQTPRTSP
jgi:hypothetical protein